MDRSYTPTIHILITLTHQETLKNTVENVIKNIFEDRFDSPIRSPTRCQGGVTTMELLKGSCKGRGTSEELPNCQGGVTAMEVTKGSCQGRGNPKESLNDCMAAAKHGRCHLPGDLCQVKPVPGLPLQWQDLSPLFYLMIPIVILTVYRHCRLTSMYLPMWLNKTLLSS